MITSESEREDEELKFTSEQKQGRTNRASIKSDRRGNVELSWEDQKKALSAL